jgi:hypothetical protein
MKPILVAVVFAGIVIVQPSRVHAQAETPNTQSALKSASSAIAMPALPPPTREKSTVIGGEIKSVDPIRDQMMLKIVGRRPVKILFDERTQIFRDGNRIALRDLGPAAHASIQTVLDGTNIYAFSVHLLSESPEGEYQGRVLSYNPNTSELAISSSIFRDPVKLIVPIDTPVVRVGQPAFTRGQRGVSDLVKGTLIAVNFQPDNKGRSVVKQISVWAIPGSEFTFNGALSALDTGAGLLAVDDPLDQKTYQIVFKSGMIPAASNLHTGDHVIITANFDGTHYVAVAIKMNN